MSLLLDTVSCCGLSYERAVSHLHRAHRLLALGLSVIPVPRAGTCLIRGTPCDGKTPILSWKPFQSRLPTVEELELWFVSDLTNIAIVTGAVSGVVVVDVDAREAWEAAARRLPATPWRTRTAKGLHLWFQHPGFHVGNRTRIALADDKLPLDVRGDGGYVMAPGSVHASGAAYRFDGDWTQPKTALPVFSPDWLLRVSSNRRAAEVTNQGTGVKPIAVDRELSDKVSEKSFDALTRARAYLAVIPPPVIGAGSDAATFTAACRLVRGFNLQSTDAERLLWEWCGNRPGWTREWVNQKVTNADKHGAELRGALL